MNTDEEPSFDNAIASVVCAICAVGIPKLLTSSHSGSGNIEIFPANLLFILLCFFVSGIAGLVFGYRGITEGRRPIVAWIGFILSLLIFISPFIPHH